MKWAIYNPTIQDPPQHIDIYTENTENNIKKGPGQSDPIPHPSPNEIAPIINFQSTPDTLIWGIYSPSNVDFLN